MPDGGLDRLIQILRDFCANPPHGYTLHPHLSWFPLMNYPNSLVTGYPRPHSSLATKITTSSSCAELEKAARKFKVGPPCLAELAVQKLNPMAHSVPYIPTPAPTSHTRSIPLLPAPLALQSSV
ncbi:hypothetical protein RSAG8_11763, partial [Rhizoctonia solani AG-8 WAC10335]